MQTRSLSPLKKKAETTAKVENCTVDSLKSTLKKYRLRFFGNLLRNVLFGILLGILQLNESLGKLPLEIGIVILYHGDRPHDTRTVA